MCKATHAILKHYSSTPEEPKHDDCPTGPNSWCSYQRNQANGTNLHKPIKNPLPDVVVEVMQPLFDHLGNDTFLVGCESCYTQNRNECLHRVIWGMASKEMFRSPQEISLAISLGVLHFNQGFNSTYSKLAPELGIQVQPKMPESWRKIDLDRIYQADYRSTPEVQKRREKKEKRKTKKTGCLCTSGGGDVPVPGISWWRDRKWKPQESQDTKGQQDPRDSLGKNNEQEGTSENQERFKGSNEK